MSIMRNPKKAAARCLRRNLPKSRIRHLILRHPAVSAYTFQCESWTWPSDTTTPDISVSGHNSVDIVLRAPNDFTTVRGLKTQVLYRLKELRDLVWELHTTDFKEHLPIWKHAFNKRPEIFGFDVVSFKTVRHDMAEKVNHVTSPIRSYAPKAEYMADIKASMDAFNAVCDSLTDDHVRKYVQANYVEILPGIYIDADEPDSIVIDETVHAFDLPDGWSFRKVVGLVQQLTAKLGYPACITPE